MSSSTTSPPSPSPPAPTIPSPTAFWNTNLPHSQHTLHCPSYLTYALTDARDRGILSTPDAAYNPQTWREVRALVAAHRLDKFTRVPSELHAYRRFCGEVVRSHGSVGRFVREERLGWRDLDGGDGIGEEGAGEEDWEARDPFADAGAYKILPNDWPYGFDPRIVHLLVWTRFRLPHIPDWDPACLTGDALTPTARRRVDDFVARTFTWPGATKPGPPEGAEQVAGAKGQTGGTAVDPEGDDEDDGGDDAAAVRVIWFCNPPGLKSVQAVEHFHVLLWDPPREVVDRLTGGRRPIVEELGIRARRV